VSVRGKVSDFVLRGKVSDFVLRGKVSDFVLRGKVSDFVLGSYVRGKVSDFVLGSYVLCLKPKTKSDLAPRSSGKENRYNRETFQMEPCG